MEMLGPPVDTQKVLEGFSTAASGSLLQEEASLALLEVTHESPFFTSNILYSEPEIIQKHHLRAAAVGSGRIW